MLLEQKYREQFQREERIRTAVRRSTPWSPDEAAAHVRGPDLEFDFRAPDYAAVSTHRNAALDRLREDPGLLKPLKTYYATNPADFITDWGVTFDPRIPAMIPFILFRRQVEWIDYVLVKWLAHNRGLTEKSRDSGISWLAIALSCTLCLFTRSLVIGFGSRLAEYVDKIGEPKSLFEKARMFLRGLPAEFLGGWDQGKHAPHMKIIFPGTGSFFSGEGGDNIGRGNRCSIYFVDEAAHLEHPLLAEASLSATTNCRQDISTPKGLGNPFEQLRHSGRIDVFTFHWKDDPRKDDDWYAKQLHEAHSPAIVAQEVDIDYAASVEGVLIPNAWVLSAVGACERLGAEVTGKRAIGFDVADEGFDLNAAVCGHGVEVLHAEEWSGKGDDIFESVERVFRLCDEWEIAEFAYDADGLGAGVRGDARVISERRAKNGEGKVLVFPVRGSEAVYDPEREDVKGRKNKDFFANRKAQNWWTVRTRFQLTHRWVSEGVRCHVDDLISISSKMDANVRSKLVSQLSQPTYSVNGVGKVLVDKMPDGSRSPNLADALVIRYARGAQPLNLTVELLQRSRLPAGAHRFVGGSEQATGQRPQVAVSGLQISTELLQRSRQRRR